MRAPGRQGLEGNTLEDRGDFATAQREAAPATTTDAPAAFEDPADTSCSAGESFALRVLGTDMAPEFNDGDIVIIEPDGALVHGCFVLAQLEGQWLLRQLCRDAQGWLLHALDGKATPADTALQDLSALRGRVIQKAVPGRRRLSKSYL